MSTMQSVTTAKTPAAPAANITDTQAFSKNAHEELQIRLAQGKVEAAHALIKNQFIVHFGEGSDSLLNTKYINRLKSSLVVLDKKEIGELIDLTTAPAERQRIKIGLQSEDPAVRNQELTVLAANVAKTAQSTKDARPRMGEILERTTDPYYPKYDNQRRFSEGANMLREATKTLEGLHMRNAMRSVLKR